MFYELPRIGERLYVFEAQQLVGERAIIDRFIR
jgi:hypothetical protein